MNEKLYKSCLNKASYLLKLDPSIELDIFQIADYLYKEENNKIERETYTDQKLLDFDDEIVEIEELGEMELMDISVSGDNLFYANGVLTKNSFGLPATLDFMIAATTDEVLQENNQQLFHLLKTRWGNKSKVKPQLVNIDFDYMRYSDVGTQSNSNVQEVQSSVGTKKPKKKEAIADIDWD